MTLQSSDHRADKRSYGAPNSQPGRGEFPVKLARIRKAVGRNCLKNGLNEAISPATWVPKTTFSASRGGRLAVPTSENGMGAAHSGEANEFTLPMNRNAKTNRFLVARAALTTPMATET